MTEAEIVNRTTPENIIDLKDNEIFVFGSNIQGLHGAGAAHIAYEKFGAKWGIGEGKTGRTYAIPTVNMAAKRNVEIKSLKEAINYFIHYARKHVDSTFLVTEIGCGLAGFKVEEVAPLFKKAIPYDNIHLLERFWRILNP